jgi:hypothetical protein
MVSYTKDWHDAFSDVNCCDGTGSNLTPTVAGCKARLPG